MSRRSSLIIYLNTCLCQLLTCSANMVHKISIVFFALFIGVSIQDEAMKYVKISCPAIISRHDWRAEPPSRVKQFYSIPRYIVIHHTPAREYCYDFESCSASMRSIQAYDLDERGWTDIGFNFCVGGDGNIYEGRGWRNMGKHIYGFNHRSIGICFIGNFDDEPVPDEMLDAVIEMINCASYIGLIEQTYIVLPHSVKKEVCPGTQLYNEIKFWPNFELTKHFLTFVANKTRLWRY